MHNIHYYNQCRVAEDKVDTILQIRVPIRYFAKDSIGGMLSNLFYPAL